MVNPGIPISLFIFSWGGVSILISYWSGWKTLAQYYPYQNEPLSQRKLFQCASMRGVSFNNCLTIGASVQGLYLAMPFLFSVGFPKLFIPWSDIKIARKEFWGIPVLELSFAKASGVSFMVREKIGIFLQETSGRSLIEGVVFQPSASTEKYQLIPIVMAILGLFAALAVFFISHK